MSDERAVEIFKKDLMKYECDDIDIKYGSGLSCFLLFDPNPNIPTPDLLYYNKFSFSF